MKQVNLSLPFSSAVMVAVVLIEFAVILAMTYQCRIAQERAATYRGMMDKMVLFPKPFESAVQAPLLHPAILTEVGPFIRRWQTNNANLTNRHP